MAASPFSRLLVSLRPATAHSAAFTTTSAAVPVPASSAARQHHPPLPPVELHRIEQAVSRIAAAASTPLEPHSLINLIDSFSSSPSLPRLCSFAFAQLRHLLTADVCAYAARAYTNSARHFQSALVYAQSHSAGILPCFGIFPCVLKSVAQLSWLRLGRSIHGHVCKLGFGSDVIANTALLNMYSTCKRLDDARQMFDEMPERNVVTWNALITGLAHNRMFGEALQLFREMQVLGFELTEVTMVNALSACAHLGALSQGKWIHNYISQNRLLLNVFVGTALIDMYAKCGSVDESERVFKLMRVKNVFTWNALISGYSMNGKGRAATEVFAKMISENVKPDSVTFLAVLCACCHQGLVDEGRKMWSQMEYEYGQRPRIEHYGCMVDLLARAGFLDEALKLVEKMPVKPDAAVWRALIGACRVHGNLKLGELAIRNLLELEPRNGENYVLLSNLYARDRRWEMVEEVRKTMIEKGIQKVPGCSSIEIDNVVYEFVVTDQSVKGASEEIFTMLADMSRKLRVSGYIVDTDMVSYDLEEEEKEGSLIYHSEKIALAFGLLRTPPGSDIRIVKNLRVCRDCHNFFKLVGKVYSRFITVRDRNRFHHFGKGVCSCNDYW